MKKSELIEILLEDYNQDIKELKEMTKSELEELYENITDEETMFPNGRDYDAEEW